MDSIKWFHGYEQYHHRWEIRLRAIALHRGFFLKKICIFTVEARRGVSEEMHESNPFKPYRFPFRKDCHLGVRHFFCIKVMSAHFRAPMSFHGTPLGIIFPYSQYNLSNSCHTLCSMLLPSGQEQQGFFIQPWAFPFTTPVTYMSRAINVWLLVGNCMTHGG